MEVKSFCLDYKMRKPDVEINSKSFEKISMCQEERILLN